MKTALITGASSGIGYELAYLFARDRHNVVLVARDRGKLARLADELRATYGITATILPKDLSQSLSPAEIFIDLREREIPVHFLVNNAGFGTYGSFAETEVTREIEMMQVNMTSLVHLTKLFLREMLSKGEGKILNVASTAAFQPGPLMAVYYATKAFVLSFSEALAEELRGTNITVTCLCPGPTQSNFQKRANQGGARFLRGGVMDAKTVAETGYRAFLRNERVVIPGLRNRSLALVSKLAPRSLVTRAVKFVQQKVHSRDAAGQPETSSVDEALRTRKT